MRVNIYLVAMMLFISLIGFIVNASELPSDPKQYESMKIEDIANLKPADFDKMISSPEGIRRVNNDEVWDKLGDDKKEMAFKKDFGAFSDTGSGHADKYFSKKLGVSASGLDFSGEHIKYDGQTITTNKGSVKLGINEIPQGTKAIEFKSYGMTLTSEGNNKLTVEDGMIAKDRSVTLSDGRKISPSMNDYAAEGQEIIIGKYFENTQIKFIGTDSTSNVAFKNPLGQMVEYSRADSSGEGSIILGENYEIKNIRIAGDSANIAVYKNAELYFDDSDHFVPNNIDRGYEGLRATEKSFVQMNSKGELNVQGRDMEIDINKPTKVTVQGERILFNDDGNKVRFGVEYKKDGSVEPFRKDSWINPKNQVTSGDYTNTFDKWNVHNYNLNVNNFNRKYIEPVTNTLLTPVKVGAGAVGLVGQGIFKGIGGVVKAFSGTNTNSNVK